MARLSTAAPYYEMYNVLDERSISPVEACEALFAARLPGRIHADVTNGGGANSSGVLVLTWMLSDIQNMVVEKRDLVKSLTTPALQLIRRHPSGMTRSQVCSATCLWTHNYNYETKINKHLHQQRMIEEDHKDAFKRLKKYLNEKKRIELEMNPKEPELMDKLNKGLRILNTIDIHDPDGHSIRFGM